MWPGWSGIGGPKASPYGGGVGEADGGGSDRQAATTRIVDPTTPPTDRCAIASPTGGGLCEPQTPIVSAYSFNNPSGFTPTVIAWIGKSSQADGPNSSPSTF